MIHIPNVITLLDILVRNLEQIFWFHSSGGSKELSARTFINLGWSFRYMFSEILFTRLLERITVIFKNTGERSVLSTNLLEIVFQLVVRSLRNLWIIGLLSNLRKLISCLIFSMIPGLVLALLILLVFDVSGANPASALAT